MGLPNPNPNSGGASGLNDKGASGRGTLGRPWWLGGTLKNDQMPPGYSAGGGTQQMQDLAMSPILQQLLQQGDMYAREGAGLRSAMVPKYAQGGTVGPGGMPLPPPVHSAQGAMMPKGAAALGVGQQQLAPQQLEAEVQRFASQNAEAVQAIREEIIEELQSGGITAQQFNMAVQLAQVALQNPSMYPQIRNYILQQGLMEEDEIPPEYDQAFLFALLVAGRSLGAGAGGAGVQPPGMAQAPQTQQTQQNQQAPVPTMASGGPVPAKNGTNKGVLIEAHEGEYVVPKHVVEMKGREFFDRMVEQYHPANMANKQQGQG